MSFDPSLTRLIERIKEDSSQSGRLVIADEHWSETSLKQLKGEELTVLTNRIDIFTSAKSLDLNAVISDFNLNEAPKPIGNIYYRVSKEKPIVNHVINQALSLIRQDSHLILTGEKGEGIKGYGDKIKKQFKAQVSNKKHGNDYSVVTNAPSNPIEESKLLDTKDYNKLRIIAESNQLSFYSKPGIYGWNKIDKGSEFLASELPQWLNEFKTKPKSLLDLGCGYGYLAISASELEFSKIVATDNNIASIYCCEENFKKNNIEGEVVLADCGDTLKEKFGCIICNPPFHQGFQIEDTLTDKFLQQCQRLLAKNGKALFVVNEFLGLEKKAASYFKSIRKVAENKTFKLIELSDGQ